MVLAIREGVNTRIVEPHCELQWKDVVRLAEANLLRAVGSWFEAVDNYVERAPLQSRHQRFPVAGHELSFAAHCLGQGVYHLFFVANVLIGIRGIGEDIRCATARVSSPAEH